MNYNITETNFKDFVIGSGWPVYKNVSVYEMTNNIKTDEEDSNIDDQQADEALTAPRYDTAPGSSYVTDTNIYDVAPRESRLMKELYSRLNKLLLGYVERILDEFEYVDSPIYDEEGIDRETLAQLVSRVTDLTNSELDQTQEIALESAESRNGWSRQQLLSAIIQSLILSEIFLVRRPKYRRARNNYRYLNGSYMGINPQ